MKNIKFSLLTQFLWIMVDSRAPVWALGVQFSEDKAALLLICIDNIDRNRAQALTPNTPAWGRFPLSLFAASRWTLHKAWLGAWSTQG